MAGSEEPILSRLDRVDNMLRQLEELRGSNRSPKSSSNVSTPSSVSEGHGSSFDLSPKPLEKHCLPINRVMLDTEIKGTLVQRIDLVEQRLLKLEGELENEKKREESMMKNSNEKSGKKKGLKGLVNCMVKGKNNHHKIKD